MKLGELRILLKIFSDEAEVSIEGDGLKMAENLMSLRVTLPSEPIRTLLDGAKKHHLLDRMNRKLPNDEGPDVD